MPTPVPRSAAADPVRLPFRDFLAQFALLEPPRAPPAERPADVQARCSSLLATAGVAGQRRAFGTSKIFLSAEAYDGLAAARRGALLARAVALQRGARGMLARAERRRRRKRREEAARREAEEAARREAEEAARREAEAAALREAEAAALQLAVEEEARRLREMEEEEARRAMDAAARAEEEEEEERAEAERRSRGEDPEAELEARVADAQRLMAAGEAEEAGEAARSTAPVDGFMMADAARALGEARDPLRAQAACASTHTYVAPPMLHNTHIHARVPPPTPHPLPPTPTLDRSA